MRFVEYTQKREKEKNKQTNKNKTKQPRNKIVCALIVFFSICACVDKLRSHGKESGKNSDGTCLLHMFVR